VQAPGIEGRAQRLARCEQVALADHLVERARAQALGQRRVGRRRRRRGGGFVVADAMMAP
jgi:hypothetical protein